MGLSAAIPIFSFLCAFASLREIFLSDIRAREDICLVLRRHLSDVRS
jgi:hypothetical protein